ncbi:MAG: hypothetical protein H7138_18925 [Myxococcales bacterium]|nr:hypothetical protein [Myxococcales bacterium]
MGRVAMFGTLLLAACDSGSGDATDGCDSEACVCDDESGCSSSSSSSASTSAGTSSSTGGTATTTTTESGEASGTEVGTTGPAAAFSELPPFDVVGASWEYDHETLATGMIRHEVCSISEVFTWPDGEQGATMGCVLEGTPLSDARYALASDRIFRRAVGEQDYDPPVELYRAPVDVGDSWELEYVIGTGDTIVETWTIGAAEPIELSMGTFDAVRVDLVVLYLGGETNSRVWWVDGIGRVRTERSDVHSELVSFSLP